MLYADDTICISENEEVMNVMLQSIDEKGARYGMKLNKNKCEFMRFGGPSKVHFTDGTEIDTKDEVKYLGCNLNKYADGGKELQKRIATCMSELKRLDLFWRHSDCSLKRKLVVYESSNQNFYTAWNPCNSRTQQSEN